MADFDAIYHMYFRDVYRYLRRLCQDAHLAEELTGETFFKALQAVDGFRGDCDMRVWLCQIARNCYLTHLRKNRRLTSLPEEQLLALPQEGGSPEEQILQKEEAAAIRAILHELAEPYKEVFLWRVYGELSFRQIGQLFGKSENWACVTYHRTRNMILSRLEARENGK